MVTQKQDKAEKLAGKWRQSRNKKLQEAATNPRLQDRERLNYPEEAGRIISLACSKTVCTSEAPRGRQKWGTLPPSSVLPTHAIPVNLPLAKFSLKPPIKRNAASRDAL